MLLEDALEQRLRAVVLAQNQAVESQSVFCEAARPFHKRCREEASIAVLYPELYGVHYENSSRWSQITPPSAFSYKKLADAVELISAR